MIADALAWDTTRDAPRTRADAAVSSLLLHPVRLDRSGPAVPWERAATELLDDVLDDVGPRPRGTAELLGVIERHGLTGHGGAHVPTAVKWRRAVHTRGPLTVVANGAESEPLSAKDSTLLQQRPHLVLDGLALTAEALGASRAVVWLHGADAPTLAAVLAAVAEAAQDKPLYWIGHSLGGQILPFVDGRARITRAFSIASGSGYWRDNTAGLRGRAWLLWHFIAPTVTPLLGYFPGRRLGIVGDLPRGVIEQWRRWCLHPQYALGEGEQMRIRYSAVHTPIVSLSFTDDEMMSQRSTEALLGFYRSAPKVSRRIAPEQLGVKRIGHFGFFREQFADTLWEGYLLPELG